MIKITEQRKGDEECKGDFNLSFPGLDDDEENDDDVDTKFDELIEISDQKKKSKPTVKDMILDTCKDMLRVSRRSDVVRRSHIFNINHRRIATYFRTMIATITNIQSDMCKPNDIVSKIVKNVVQQKFYKSISIEHHNYVEDIKRRILEFCKNK